MKRVFFKNFKIILLVCVVLLFIFLYKPLARLKYMPLGYGDKVKSSVGSFQKSGKIYRYYYRYKSEAKFKGNENYKRVDNETDYIQKKIETFYQKYPELLDSEFILDKDIVYAADYYSLEEKSELEFNLYYYDASEATLYYIECK